MAQRTADRLAFNNDSCGFLLRVFDRAFGNNADVLDRLQIFMAPGTHGIRTHPSSAARQDQFLSWLAEYMGRAGSEVQRDRSGRIALSDSNKRTIFAYARDNLGINLSSIPLRIQPLEAPIPRHSEMLEEYRAIMSEDSDPSIAFRSLARFVEKNHLPLNEETRVALLRSLREIRSQIRPYSQRIERLSLSRITIIVDRLVAGDPTSQGPDETEFYEQRRRAYSESTRMLYWVNAAIKLLESPPEHWDRVRIGSEVFSRVARFYDSSREFDRSYAQMLGVIVPARDIRKYENWRDFFISTSIAIATSFSIDRMLHAFASVSTLREVGVSVGGALIGSELGGVVTGTEPHRVPITIKAALFGLFKARYPMQYQRVMDWLERSRTMPPGMLLAPPAVFLVGEGSSN